MKSYIQNTPASTSSLHYRSLSKKHNSDYISPSCKLFNKRSVSKKGTITSYGYCPKDIETLKDQNSKLKEQIQGLRTQVSEQKGLIISLQRLVSTPQFRGSISTQKSININLQQEKQRLAERLKVVERELSVVKKETRNVSMVKVLEERSWYKEEVMRLRKLLVVKINGDCCQSETRIKSKEEEEREADEIKQSFVMRTDLAEGHKSTITFQEAEQKQNIRSSNESSQKQQQRTKTSLCKNRLKRGFKDSIVVSRGKIKESTRNVLEHLNNKLHQKQKQRDRVGSNEEKQAKVGFNQETILPYNQYYYQRSLGSFRGKSVIEKRDFDESIKRSFIS